MEITYDSWMEIVAAILLGAEDAAVRRRGIRSAALPDVLVAHARLDQTPGAGAVRWRLAGLGFALETRAVVPVLMVAWLAQRSPRRCQRTWSVAATYRLTPSRSSAYRRR